MTTALSVPQHQLAKYAAFEPTRLEVMRENMDGQSIGFFDLPVVKTPPGGAPFFTLDTVSGPKPLDTITGVLAFTTLHGVLWPSNDSAGGSKPVLVTRDMKTARMASPELATRDPSTGRITAITGAPSAMVQVLSESENLTTNTWDWMTLPYTQFGSGRDGMGKAAKEGRLAFVCTADSALPICLRMAPSSLKAMKSILLKLELPYYHYIWQFSLQIQESKRATKEKYSAIVPKIVGTLSPEDAAVVASNWKGPLEREWRGADISKVVDAVSEPESGEPQE